MSSRPPSIMVSSTCYDLKQIRKDLFHFIEDELGYRALLSEANSFPVDPTTDAIENCKRTVENEADVLILVIGGRYGYIDADTNKSVTNLEYLSASAKGIPIYVFINKGILANLQVWKNNLLADFSSVVDNTRLFDFITDICEKDKVWRFEFEIAQDIISTLRTQFAYRMSEGLQLSFLLSRSKLSDELSSLRGNALRIALEKPIAWDTKLLVQLLSDELEKYDHLRFQHKNRITIGQGERIEITAVANWIVDKNNELLSLIRALSTTVNDIMNSGLRNPAERYNIKTMITSVRLLGDIYSRAIEWSNSIGVAHVDDVWMSTLVILSTFADVIIEKIESFGLTISNGLNDVIATLENGETKFIDYTFEIESPNIDDFNKEFQKALSEIRSHIISSI